MRVLCSNCRWLEKDFDQCKQLRKGFDCTRYHVKLDIETKRTNDVALNDPFSWLGSRKKLEARPAPLPINPGNQARLSESGTQKSGAA